MHDLHFSELYECWEEITNYEELLEKERKEREKLLK
jgi:hypothetical protein